MIRPFIAINHSAFSAPRRVAYDKLHAELLPQCQDRGIELFTHHDTAGKGSLAPWMHVLEYATTRENASHATFLPDDALLVPHFVEVLTAAIAAHPDEVMCFQSNHHGSPVAAAGGARWYTTSEGYTGFGGTMPIALVREHFAWRQANLKQGIKVAGDEAINLWAMATGRLIWKSLPSLVDHDLSLKSEDGNDHHIDKSPRRPLVWQPDVDLRGVDWSGPVVHLGRTYENNHWGIVTKLTKPLARKAYALEQDHTVLRMPDAP
jgi:hypothetical protein